MRSTFRTLGLALIMLGVFLASTFSLQWWLGRQTRQLQAETVQARRGQLEQFLELQRNRDGTVDERALAAWGGALGGRLAVFPREAPAARSESGTLVAECPLPGRPDRVARLSFPFTAGQRLASLHLQVISLTILLALLLLLVPVLIALSHRDPADAGNTRTRGARPGRR
ncbi:MAG: hypothetical protein ACHQ5A_08880 [Opitutales bacterium]